MAGQAPGDAPLPLREMPALRIERGERQSFRDAVIEEAPVTSLPPTVRAAVSRPAP